MLYSLDPALNPQLLPLLKVRTALNMLGPLLNPAHAAYGLVGTYSTDILELMAGALLVRKLGYLLAPFSPPENFLDTLH